MRKAARLPRLMMGLGRCKRSVDIQAAEEANDRGDGLGVSDEECEDGERLRRLVLEFILGDIEIDERAPEGGARCQSTPTMREHNSSICSIAVPPDTKSWFRVMTLMVGTHIVQINLESANLSRL